MTHSIGIFRIRCLNEFFFSNSAVIANAKPFQFIFGKIALTLEWAWQIQKKIRFVLFRLSLSFWATFCWISVFRSKLTPSIKKFPKQRPRTLQYLPRPHYRIALQDSPSRRHHPIHHQRQHQNQTTPQFRNPRTYPMPPLSGRYGHHMWVWSWTRTPCCAPRWSSTAMDARRQPSVCQWVLNMLWKILWRNSTFFNENMVFLVQNQNA